MPKAIVMDMDGTLLSPDDKILPETKEKLLQLQDKGVQLVLASGRSFTRLMPYAKDLEMDKHKGWLLEVDGVALYDLDKGERHVLQRMEPERIKDVFNDLVHQECEVMACFDDGFFYHYPESIRQKKEALRKEKNIPDDFPWTAGPWSWLADLRGGYPHQTFVTDASQISRPVNKIQLMLEEKDVPAIYGHLVKEYGDQFEVFRTTPRQLEILPKGCSKGATLHRLMEEQGWKPDEVLVFGDGENDVSMFEQVKDSYAMGNAQPFVQEQASHVTLSNKDNGIAKALEKIA